MWYPWNLFLPLLSIKILKEIQLYMYMYDVYGHPLHNDNCMNINPNIGSSFTFRLSSLTRTEAMPSLHPAA